MLFLCVILHTMWSGKSLQMLCILPFGRLHVSAIRIMSVKIRLVCMFLLYLVQSWCGVCVKFNHHPLFRHYNAHILRTHKVV